MTTSERSTFLFENLFFSRNEFVKFEQNILQLAKKMALPLQNYEIDHIAVRVNTEQSAQRWLSELTKCGKILSSNLVNGRKIYLIQLDKPLIIANQLVDVIELPFPKNKQYPQEGWEHIEVVIPFLPKETINEWIERINSYFLWDKISEVSIKISTPKVEGETLANPSIAVNFVNSEGHHCCIKVHPFSIRAIIDKF
ncbi:VOC family protein [Avibacterium paragallinarum]|uniref:VOC family protein n=1 Tax=Avibacterium paragallinarum TaxID=728 RepID=A0AAE5TI92_AVIPA|nr:VOC family protein [Avibacterium paragallinarum]MEE3608880.1 VOC family protein [Avibacterium paragallinarum]MEE3622060.1 VOC family protein [Avibacterium paragallinarum]MEE3669066.1 VOC family protein [Avibacterium paragallinarum]MEE3680705.1 VOC family protein [Avibacterium paragallinarum]MEE4386061.1 VOC family protein [Avibacterium paragallinarum]